MKEKERESKRERKEWKGRYRLKEGIREISQIL